MPTGRSDRAVDCCYGAKSFSGERERVGFLFDIYQRMLDGECRKSVTARITRETK
jgi:hypothetical protein